jgi:hypothetical protein
MVASVAVAALSPKKRRTTDVLRTTGYYALVCLAMLPTLFVFYWMVTLSLKTQVEAAGYPPHFFRFAVTFKNYAEVFQKNPFILYIWNSSVVAAGSTALGLIVGLPAAFSIARWRQQGLVLTVLVARIIPGISGDDDHAPGHRPDAHCATAHRLRPDVWGGQAVTRCGRPDQSASRRWTTEPVAPRRE